MTDDVEVPIARLVDYLWPDNHAVACVWQQVSQDLIDNAADPIDPWDYAAAFCRERVRQQTAGRSVVISCSRAEAPLLQEMVPNWPDGQHLVVAMASATGTEPQVAADDSPIRANLQRAADQLLATGGVAAPTRMSLVTNATRPTQIRTRMGDIPSAQAPQAPQLPIARNFRDRGEAISITCRVQELEGEAPVRCERCGYWSFLTHARHVCPGGNRWPNPNDVRAPWQPAPLRVAPHPDAGVTRLHYRGSHRMQDVTDAQETSDVRGPEPSMVWVDEMAECDLRVRLVTRSGPHYDVPGQVTTNGDVEFQVPADITITDIAIGGMPVWPHNQAPHIFPITVPNSGTTVTINGMSPQTIESLRQLPRPPLGPRPPEAWKGLPREELNVGDEVMVTLPMKIWTAEDLASRRIETGILLDPARMIYLAPLGGIEEIRERG